MLQLMEERRKFKTKRHEHADVAKHHNYLCRRVKKSAKEDKENYIAELCQKVETADIQNKAKTVFESSRKITGKYPSQVSVVKGANLKIITDLDALKARKRDYFSQLYNDPNEVNGEFMDNIQDSCNSENIPGIGEDEVLAATDKLKHRKAAGLDISRKDTGSKTKVRVNSSPKTLQHGMGIRTDTV